MFGGRCVWIYIWCDGAWAVVGHPLEHDERSENIRVECLRLILSLDDAPFSRFSGLCAFDILGLLSRVSQLRLNSIYPLGATPLKLNSIYEGFQNVCKKCAAIAAVSTNHDSPST